MERPLGSSYLLNDQIGRGAMGEVWRASTRAGGEPVAVKVLRRELASDPEIVSRFLMERSILLGLRHPNVVAVRDLVAEGDTLAIVMDLVEGTDLRRVLSAGPLPPAVACDLLRQVAEGLAAAHASGVIHRDLKPENILVDDGATGAPRALVTDFGIATIAGGPALTRLTGVIGTPEYMAPEVIEHERATPSSDLYSCGVALYEALAGRSPFGGGHPVAVLRRHLDEAPARPPGVPDAVWDLIASLLAKDAADRPASAIAVAARLGALSAGLGGVSPLSVVPSAGRGIPALTVVRTPPPAATSGDAVAGQRPTELRRGARAPAPAPEPAATPPHQRTAEPAEAGGRRARWGRWSRWGPPRRAALIGLPVLLIAGGVVTGLSLRGSPPAAPAAGYAFAPVTYPNGVVVSRLWQLAAGRLSGTLTITNSSASPVTATFDEVIPKSLAPSVDAVRFRPTPDAVVRRDPVVRFDLNGLAPGERRRLGYDVAVGAKRGQGTLTGWVGDQSAAESSYVSSTAEAGTAPTSLARLLVSPSPVSLLAGQVVLWQVSGTMSDGSPAPAAVLAGVAWSSSAPSVAEADAQGVAGVAAGSATITAQAGSLSVTIPVVVSQRATLAAPSARPPKAATSPALPSPPLPSPNVTSTEPVIPPAATRSPTAPPPTTPAPAPSPSPSPAATTPAPVATTPAAPPPPPPPPDPYLGTDTRFGGQTILVNQYIRSDDGRFTLVLQGDGNLVLYAPGNQALWSAGVQRANPSMFIVQGTDGNMVLYDSNHVAYWSSTTSVSGPALRVQNDGNVVLHSGGTVMGPVAWNTQTHYP